MVTSQDASHRNWCSQHHSHEYPGALLTYYNIDDKQQIEELVGLTREVRIIVKACETQRVDASVSGQRRRLAPP